MENIKDIFFDINFINDVIDGLVDDVTAAEFFEHINECENCRRAYEETLKIRETMRQDGFLPGTEGMPSADFAEKTMAKIRAAKKPLIIRIINHPAVKTAAAAVAVLLIAVFVFRSDLFGKIDGANGIAGEMIATDTRKAEGVTEETSSLFAMEMPEAPEEIEDAAETDTYVTYNAETGEITEFEQEDYFADDSNDAYNSGYTESYIPPELPTAEEETVIEEAVGSSVKSAYDANGTVEEAPTASVPESTTTSSSSSGSAWGGEESAVIEEVVPEEAVDEIAITETQEESVIIEMPEESCVVTEEAVITEETTEEGPPTAADATVSTSPQARAVYGIYATEKDIATARAVAGILAKDDLGGGVYTKIILVLPNYGEDFNINPDIYKKIGQTEYDGYIYTAYECTVYGGNDTVAAEYGSNAMEIYPEIATEYSDREILLVLFREDK